MACAGFFENVGVTDGLLDYQAYGPPQALRSNGCTSPRFSFSGDLPDADLVANERTNGDKERVGDADFEFCMILSEDPRSSNAMLPADELFFQGKLRPLQPRRTAEIFGSADEPLPVQETRNGRTQLKSGSKQADRNDRSSAAVEDPSTVNLKAAKPSGKWKGLLGLKKLQIPTASSFSSCQKIPARWKSDGAPSKSLKKLLFTGGDYRRLEPSTSATQPLLPNRDSSADSAAPRESVSSALPADLSVEEFPRQSVDSQKEDAVLGKTLRVKVGSTGQEKSNRGRVAKTQAGPKKINTRGVSLDSSPRMTGSGKIVFRGLERSCSSPSSFNRSLRKKGNSSRQSKDGRKGLERSYSASVKITPVLNVPACMTPSLRSVKASKGGIFGLTNLFTQKKENGGKPVRNPQSQPLSGSSIQR